MKINNILKPFKENLDKFLDYYGDHTSDSDCFYVRINDVYYAVEIKNSYWYYEDDGTVVCRIIDTTGDKNE